MKIVCVGPYENTFFTLLATEDTYAVGVAYIASIEESLNGNMSVEFEREE